MEATPQTQEFTTEHTGKKIVIKTFITGFDNRRLQDCYIDAPADMPQSAKMHLVTDEALRTVIVSIDGQTENIVEAIMGLDNRDTQEIIRRVNEVTQDKKKQVNTSTT